MTRKAYVTGNGIASAIVLDSKMRLRLLFGGIPEQARDVRGMGRGNELIVSTRNRVLRRCFFTRLHDVLVIFANCPGFFPGDFHFHLSAAFTVNDRYQGRDVKTDIELIFVQPAGFADP